MKEENRKQPRFKAGSGVWLIVMLLALPNLSIGCGLLNKDIILHPIQGTDIVMLKQGETLTAPKNGAFLSDTYISDVMEAKVR